MTDRPSVGGDRRLRLLFVTPYVPSQLRPRPAHFIRHLAERGHRITVVALATSNTEVGAVQELRPWTEDLHVIPVTRLRSLWNCAKAIRSPLPLQAAFAFSPAARRLIDGLLGGADRFDLAHVEHLRAAPLALAVQGVPVVFDAVDCISRLLEATKRQAATFPTRLAARIDLRRTRRFEAELSARCACVLTSSAADQRALLALAERAGLRADGKIQVLGGGVDLAHFQAGASKREKADLVYVGRMGYHSNDCAARWLIGEIMPVIWARRPDVRLKIVGEGPSAGLRRLASKHASRVVVTGYVPDVRPHLAPAAVSVNSLVYGVGMQNKVLEAMAVGTAVVTTPVGCSALHTRDGEHLLVASDAQGFAEQVLRLLGDSRLRERLAAAGRSYVEQHHAWPVIVRKLEQVYEGVLAENPTSLR